MLKFLMQRFLGDSLRSAILRGLDKSMREKLNLEDPLDREQIAFNVAEQIALDSERGIDAARALGKGLNKVRTKRVSRFKP